MFSTKSQIEAMRKRIEARRLIQARRGVLTSTGERRGSLGYKSLAAYVRTHRRPA